MTAAQKIRAEVHVQGRVQGVAFRAGARAQALLRGVQGYARNLPCGGVQMAFEGAPSAVAAMVEWCGQGPPGAQVTRLQSRTAPPQGARGFQIA